MASEKFRFDTELLISTVEQKPCIWDTSSENYKNRDLKNNAWEEVAEIVIQNFVKLDEAKQQGASKYIVFINNVIRNTSGQL